jgi:hypothetical protein
VKACADFEQRRDVAHYTNTSSGRVEYSSHETQERALPSAVPADDRNRFSSVYLQVDAIERPEVSIRDPTLHESDRIFLELSELFMRHPVSERDLLQTDGDAAVLADDRARSS